MFLSSRQLGIRRGGGQLAVIGRFRSRKPLNAPIFATIAELKDVKPVNKFSGNNQPAGGSFLTAYCPTALLPTGLELGADFTATSILVPSLKDVPVLRLVNRALAAENVAELNLCGEV